MCQPVALESRCLLNDIRLPRRINKSDNIGIEGAIDRIQDSKLGKRLHGEKKHEAYNQVTDDLE